MGFYLESLLLLYIYISGVFFVDGTFSFNVDDETVCIEFPNKLTEKSGPIHIEYSGVLNDQMRGFYRSKYLSSGEERYAAVTQFEVSCR